MKRSEQRSESYDTSQRESRLGSRRQKGAHRAIRNTESIAGIRIGAAPSEIATPALVRSTAPFPAHMRVRMPPAHTHARLGGWVDTVRSFGLCRSANVGSRRVVASLRHPGDRAGPIRKRDSAGHVAGPAPPRTHATLLTCTGHGRPFGRAEARAFAACAHAGHKMATRRGAEQ